MHPELLTKALLQKAQERGGSLQLAAVTGVQAAGGRVMAVHVRDSGSGEERTLPADAVVFAMGGLGGGWLGAGATGGWEEAGRAAALAGTTQPPLCCCAGPRVLCWPATCPPTCRLPLFPCMSFLPCFDLAGAWSSQLASWLPDSCPDVYSGLKVHSIVLADSQQQTTADALFLAYR